MATYWLWEENCQDDVDSNGDGDESGCSDQVTSDGLLNNLEEMSFPIKVPFCLSDEDDKKHGAKSRIIVNNSNDGNEVICS